jgi:hypothetical protein
MIFAEELRTSSTAIRNAKTKQYVQQHTTIYAHVDEPHIAAGRPIASDVVTSGSSTAARTAAEASCMVHCALVVQVLLSVSTH